VRLDNFPPPLTFAVVSRQWDIIGSSSVALPRWTPNALRYQVDAPTPAAVVINQNYDSSWSLARGTGVVFSEKGLLGVQVPPGRQEIELVYRDRLIIQGVVIALATLLAAVAIWRLEPKWRRSSRPG